jgi:CheY-like chemotaxis protein
MSERGIEDVGPAASPPGRRVLVVDDSPDFLLLMRELLTVEGGCEVATLSQSESVLEWVDRVAPDAIILDIAFHQGPSGLEVAEQLAGASGLGSIPVLFCTALAERDLGADALAAVVARGQRILYKPFDLDELLGVVNELLQQVAAPGVPGVPALPVDLAPPARRRRQPPSAGAAEPP